MGNKNAILPIARAISDSAFGLAIDPGSTKGFIEDLSKMSHTLDDFTFIENAEWTRLDISLMESTYQSLRNLKIALERQHVWPEVLPAINELLPKMDDFLDTAIVAIDPEFWQALKEVKDGDMTNYVTIQSLDEL